MRHPVYYVGYRYGAEPGEPLHVQLPEGACLVLFAYPERAERWMDAMLNDRVREGVMVVELRTLEEVERFWERWGMDFNVMSLNPVPDPKATPHWEPIDKLLEIAHKQAGP